MPGATRYIVLRLGSECEVVLRTCVWFRLFYEADPQKAKALLGLLIDELRVNGRAEILPTYRLVTPAVCAMSEKVEAAGIEPASADAPV